MNRSTAGSVAGNAGPAVITTTVPQVPVELVTAATARAIASAQPQSDVTGNAIYVEPSAADLVAAVQTTGGPGQSQGGIQLTTITVAVPGPLSPSDPEFQAAAAAANQPLPPALNPPPSVALPTVPAPQECNFKWKYEQNKEKSGTSLVSNPSLLNLIWD